MDNRLVYGCRAPTAALPKGHDLKRFVDRSDSREQRVLQRMLNLDQTVSQFKQLILSFGIDPSEQPFLAEIDLVAIVLPRAR